MNARTIANDAEPFFMGPSRVVAQTNKAIRVAIERLDERVWIPKSVVHLDSEIFGGSGPDGFTGNLIVERWWAAKEGWITE